MILCVDALNMQPQNYRPCISYTARSKRTQAQMFFGIYDHRLYAGTSGFSLYRQTYCSVVIVLLVGILD